MTMECFYCNATNQVEKCQECPMVYCGSHKLVHRPEKLEKCLPIIVSFIENVGRVLRAAETIKKGQLAMFDRAFTIGNLTSFVLNSCCACAQ